MALTGIIIAADAGHNVATVNTVEDAKVIGIIPEILDIVFWTQEVWSIFGDAKVGEGSEKLGRDQLEQPVM